jgi:DNA-binding SARP family transcriptional activator
LRFEVLGPVRAWSNDVELDLGSPQQRTVLAILLLSQGWQVPMDILVDAIWGEDPPRAAVGTVRTYISRLRRRLDPATGYRAAELLKSAGDGYAIETGAVSVDIELFTQQVQRAQLTRSHGDLTLAASQLGEALRLWRGMPLAGLQGPYADSQRARLLELRVAVTEERLCMDIESGAHLAAITELRTLLDEHPLRENLSELLMLALYRAGRQADALTLFDGLRRLLRDELGIDPGPGLREMHERILRADDNLIPPAGDSLTSARTAGPAGPPTQLPPAHADLTGRADTLGAVVAALKNSSAAPVVAITGMPGIGKTALAIQAAHAARAAFPDGQLYAALGDADGTPADPTEVLTRLHRSLGDAFLPGPPEERVSAFPDEPAGRRVLVVLDGVRDTAQAHLLLDGLRGYAVIVTTQRRMINLPGARWFEVDPLLPDEGLDLLERLIGRERVAANRVGAEWLIALCAGQPIAIRTAAGRLIARPAWEIAEMARQLKEELSQPVITHADCELVEAPFELAYQRLADDQAFMFRQAALSDSPEISPAAVAALTGMPEHQVFAKLESLADVHLVQAGVFGSYRYDPLVKLYAQRKALAADVRRRAFPARPGDAPGGG